MREVSRSVPFPSISKAWGMLPPLVTVKLTGPAGTVALVSRMVHSDRVAPTATGSWRRGVAAWNAARVAAKAVGSIRVIGFGRMRAVLAMGWRRFVRLDDSQPTAIIPQRINSSPGESTPNGPSRHALEDR